MKYLKGQKFRKLYQYQNLSTVLLSEKTKRIKGPSINDIGPFSDFNTPLTPPLSSFY